MFQELTSVTVNMELHRSATFRVVEAVQWDLNISFLFPQIPHRQYTTDLLHFSFFFFFLDREPPTRPASCGMRLIGEFYGFLLILMGPCIFGVKSAQFISDASVCCSCLHSLLGFFFCQTSWLTKPFAVVGTIPFFI